MTPETRDQLLSIGTRRIAAALARHDATGRIIERLPVRDPFAGPASLTIESCRAGSVLVGEAPDRMLERLRQRGIAGVVAPRELSGLPVDAGDAILRDRDSLVVIPSALVETVAEEAAEAIAFEEFTADQVAQGGGVYGLHIPSGDRARQAFAAWRRMKGR
jgi:regulator of RNase E activity RraA